MTTHAGTGNHQGKDAVPQFPLLPACLLQLELRHLQVPTELAATLRAGGLDTVGDLLALPASDFAAGAALGPRAAEALRAALEPLLLTGLRDLVPATAATPAVTWLRLQDQLLAPLAEDERHLLRDVLGIGVPPLSLTAIARRDDRDLRAIEDLAAGIRTRLHEAPAAGIDRLRAELEREFRAFDGVVDDQHLAIGSVLHTVARGANDPQLALRLAAFCFPQDVHLHGARLVAVSPRRFRRLERQLRGLVVPHRLPLAIDALLADLATRQVDAPRGVVLHLLRSVLHVNIEIDGERGEVAVPDPRSPAARLADLLAEVGHPMPLEDLVFAYRERYRSASRPGIVQRLRRDPTFVMVGPDTWSLRAWHEQDLLAVAPLVDQAARRICTEGGKQSVAGLLAAADADPRAVWLVQDRLAADPRVRLLGRGEVCPATHKRSQVLDQLLHDFRRAGGDVVTSLFVQNQPAARRRLVARLLRENRLFVMPSEDRIDVLANYPFNQERLQRLVELVANQLAQRTGYAHANALKLAVDRAELGGSWLTPTLLADLLRRHGPFEVLPGGLIGKRDLGLGSRLMRTVRQALRDAGVPVSVDEILRARPDLAEFASCLQELLRSDPLVQTPDGARFTLV